jgi:hypothetical protein
MTLAQNPVVGFQVDPNEIRHIGKDRLTPEVMLEAGGTIAPWFASVALGGPDLKTAYVGSLKGTRIHYFQSPVAGLPMVHWR